MIRHSFLRRYQTLFFILLFALGIRLVYLLVVVHPQAPPTNIDAIEYDSIARNVLEGSGYSLYGHPTANRAPGLPFYLTGIYKIFGHRYTVVRLGMIVLALSLILVIYKFAEMIGNRRIALWSAFIASLWPPFIFFGVRLFTEIPFTLFSILTLYFVEKYIQSHRLVFLIIAGLSGGLAILTRPVGLFLLIFVTGYLFFKMQGRAEKIHKSLLYFIIGTAVIAPWIWRNYQTFQTFVPVTTQGSLVFYVSNNHYVAHHPTLWGRYSLYQHLPGTRKLIIQDEIQRARNARALAIDHLRKYYRDIPRLAWNKFRRFWYWEYTVGSRYPWIYEFSYLVIFIGFLAGAGWSLIHRDRRTIVLWILIAANLLPALIFWAGTRVRVPADPALIIFSAIALKALWNRWKKSE